MNWIRNMKSHLKVTDWLLALAKIELKEKNLSEKKWMCQTKEHWVSHRDRTPHRQHCPVFPAYGRGRPTEMMKLGKCISYEGWNWISESPNSSFFMISHSQSQSRPLGGIWLFHTWSLSNRKNWLEDTSVRSPWQSTLLKNITNVFWIPIQVSCQLVGNTDKTEFWTCKAKG